MNGTEFQKILETAKGLEIVKRALKEGAKIEWETDTAKLSEVNNGNRYKALALRIKEFPVSELTTHPMELFETEGGEITRDEMSLAHTCYLISQGVKIVPPVRINRWVIADGELKMKGRINAHYSDGSHRVFLAKLLGYETIPVICADILDGYSFSVCLWSFDYQESKIIATKFDGEETIEVKLDDETCISQSNTGKIWVDYHTARLLQ